MFDKKWKSEIFTIPNALSLLRLTLIPVYMRLYLQAQEPRQFTSAGMVLALSCLTDALDGQIARRCNMVSTLGKILDPLADKITQFSLILCLAMKYPVLDPVLILFTVKELFQLALGVFYLSRGKILPGALPAGKLCTTVLFVTLSALVFFPHLNSRIVRYIAMTDLLFLTFSLISYSFAYFSTHAWTQQPDTE